MQALSDDLLVHILLQPIESALVRAVEEVLESVEGTRPDATAGWYNTRRVECAEDMVFNLHHVSEYLHEPIASSEMDELRHYTCTVRLVCVKWRSLVDMNAWWEALFLLMFPHMHPLRGFPASVCDEKDALTRSDFAKVCAYPLEEQNWMDVLRGVCSGEIAGITQRMCPHEDEGLMLSAATCAAIRVAGDEAEPLRCSWRVHYFSRSDGYLPHNNRKERSVDGNRFRKSTWYGKTPYDAGSSLDAAGARRLRKGDEVEIMFKFDIKKQYLQWVGFVHEVQEWAFPAGAPPVTVWWSLAEQKVHADRGFRIDNNEDKLMAALDLGWEREIRVVLVFPQYISSAGVADDWAYEVLCVGRECMNKRGQLIGGIRMVSPSEHYMWNRRFPKRHKTWKR